MCRALAPPAIPRLPSSEPHRHLRTPSAAAPDPNREWPPRKKENSPAPRHVATRAPALAGQPAAHAAHAAARNVQATRCRIAFKHARMDTDLAGGGVKLGGRLGAQAARGERGRLVGIAVRLWHRAVVEQLHTKQSRFASARRGMRAASTCMQWQRARKGRASLAARSRQDSRFDYRGREGAAGGAGRGDKSAVPTCCSGC